MPHNWFGSDLFLSDMPALNDLLQSRCGAETTATVLIARLTPSRHGELCVVEKVKNSLYALTRLDRCLDEREVLVAAKDSADADADAIEAVQHGGDSMSFTQQADEDENEHLNWWEDARIDDLGLVPPKQSKLDDISVVFAGGVPGLGETASSFADNGGVDMSLPENLDVLSSGMSDPSFGLKTPALSREQSDATLPLSADMDVGSGGGENNVQLSTQELLDGVIEQYLHTLYVSKV